MTECPICNGKGYVYNALGSFYEDCGHCQGTGKVKAIGEPMTNEEWLRSATTEELIELLAELVDYGIIMAWMEDYHCADDERTAIDKWLKEKHNDL